MSDEQDQSSGLESDEPYVPKTTGWPMWDLEAEKILSGIRAHIFDPSAIGIVALGQRAVQKGENNSDIAFHDFLQILDAFLSQLVQRAEWKELGELHNGQDKRSRTGCNFYGLKRATGAAKMRDSKKGGRNLPINGTRVRRVRISVGLRVITYAN